MPSVLLYSFKTKKLNAKHSPQDQTAPILSPSTSLSGLSTHRVAATCYPLQRSFSNGFYNTVLKEKQGRECVIIIKAEGRGRIGGDFALYISRFRTAQKLEYLFDVQYFFH